MRVPLVVFIVVGACLRAAAMLPAAPQPPSQPRPTAPVILDPGHGGGDLGAVVHGIQEKDIALAVARKVRDRLTAWTPVMLTREDDHYVTLDRRVVDAADWDGALFVSIHLNQVRSRRSAGAVVYSFGATGSRRRSRRRHRKVPWMPAPPRVESRGGDALARAIVTELRRDGVNAKQARSDYYVLKEPAEPSVLVELGYLSNPAEAKRLTDPAYQDRLADSLAKAIHAFAVARAVRGQAPVAAALAEAPAAAAKNL